MREGCGGDESVHGLRAQAPLSRRGDERSVPLGHRAIDRQHLELGLYSRERRDAKGGLQGVFGEQDADVELGDRRGGHGQLIRERIRLAALPLDQDGRIDDALHRGSVLWSTAPSTSWRKRSSRGVS